MAKGIIPQYIAQSVTHAGSCLQLKVEGLITLRVCQKTKQIDYLCELSVDGMKIALFEGSLVSNRNSHSS